jgi:hypothetical protein
MRRELYNGKSSKNKARKEACMIKIARIDGLTGELYSTQKKESSIHSIKVRAATPRMAAQHITRGCAETQPRHPNPE